MLTLAIPFILASAAIGQTTMDAAKAQNTRYDGDVAAWYGSHSEDSPKHDWVPIKEWDGPFHPVLGEYKTDDRKIIRQHLQWMRRAGIDVLFYDTCRIQPDLTLLDIDKQKTLKLLAEELADQKNETRKLKLVVWMEKWNSNPTPQQFRFGLDYVRKNLADRDFYYRLNGKPLVMTYLNKSSPELDAISREYDKFFTIRYISPDPALPGWRYIGPGGDKECMTANPGFDSFMEEAFIAKYVNKQPIDEKAVRERAKAAIAQRADGKFFQQQILQARQTDPKLIFISGWNDWACCLQIEPAKEYGFKYVDQAARLLGRENETRPYRQPQ